MSLNNYFQNVERKVDPQLRGKKVDPQSLMIVARVP